MKITNGATKAAVITAPRRRPVSMSHTTAVQMANVYVDGVLQFADHMVSAELVVNPTRFQSAWRCIDDGTAQPLVLKWTAYYNEESAAVQKIAASLGCGLADLESTHRIVPYERWGTRIQPTIPGTPKAGAVICPRYAGSACELFMPLRGRRDGQTPSDPLLVPPKVVEKLLIHTATALNSVHQSGLIHGDVKLANIFLDHQCNAFLGDFGSAVENGQPFRTLTRQQAIRELVSANIACPAYDWSCLTIAGLLLLGKLTLSDQGYNALDIRLHFHRERKDAFKDPASKLLCDLWYLHAEDHVALYCGGK